MEPNGAVSDTISAFNNAQGTATITFQSDPVPEASSLLGFGSLAAMTAVGLLRRRRSR